MLYHLFSCVMFLLNFQDIMAEQAHEHSGKKLKFAIPELNATATATLRWEEAPRTCSAIIELLPFSSKAFHGRNSGDEALLLTPTVIEDVPQNETEGATTNHIKGGIYFGLERGGESYGGALPGENCSEICWFYGHAGQAQYWVSAHGPQHNHYGRKDASL